MSQLPKYVNTALLRLEQAGFEACIVGGCVRDRLMGRTPADYDVATSALPEQTALVFADERVIETGIQHGTVTVLLGGKPLEITTYRIDGSYSDSRHPDYVRFTPSLREDLARRDFTMNAIAFNKSGIFDPFGGQKDIAAGLIRCVGDPETRFREDALRILRALRFSSVLGFRIEPATAVAARHCAELLRGISAERTAAELKKLVCGKNARSVVLEYVDVLGVVLPELLPMRGFDQRNRHHNRDVLSHSAAAMEHMPPESVLRLAALFHDVGKPERFTVDAQGVGHFYGHARRSAEIADAVAARLRLDRASRERIVTLIRHHDLIIEPEERAVKRALGRLTPDVFFQLLQLKRADNLAQAPEYHTRQSDYDRLEAIARDIIAEQQCFCLRDLAVNGNDLRAAGMQPGKSLGSALELLLGAVIEGSVENEKSTLLAYLRDRGTL